MEIKMEIKMEKTMKKTINRPLNEMWNDSLTYFKTEALAVALGSQHAVDIAHAAMLERMHEVFLNDRNLGRVYREADLLALLNRFLGVINERK
jgi:hypothetical protein